MLRKRKTEFKIPYLGIDEFKGYPILYNEKGDFGVILSLRNPVLQYSADPWEYDNFHQLYVNVLKILGEGYFIQKQDIISKTGFQSDTHDEFLQQKYDEHFQGRVHTTHKTFLVITKKTKPGYYTHSEKDLNDFHQSIGKLIDHFTRNGLAVKVLDEAGINHHIMRILSMNFHGKNLALNNILAGDLQIEMGETAVKSISLVNTDVIDLPQNLTTHSERNDKDTLKGFPIDNMGFLFSVPNFKTMLYNQVIEIVPQTNTQRKLELKRKRHSGIPDPANNMCVEDIDQLLEDINRNNQLLVNSHFNLVVACDREFIQGTSNYIESSLFQQGIIPSNNAYNQLELFRSVLPCNSSELKHYDYFLTTSDAALCFFFKERMPEDEVSNFQIRLTDRHGIPVKIDPADLPMQNNRINNRNKFVLGPSGSGKSFFMNTLLEQYSMYNKSKKPKWLMDIVIVDTGHSYQGLCNYLGGVYVTWKENDPITTNPFAIAQEEYNIEKKEFLLTLVSVLWKSAEGTFSQVEADVISSTISSYYASYFTGEGRISRLCFNSFYQYALYKIPLIKEEEKIPFNLDEFRFVLKKFTEGEFEPVLNKEIDSSLFEESFVVFEIDSIKEHKVLFPIVTLIIMDVFIQKMRFRTKQRKALVIEEAWKAISSPLMANYILYLFKTVRKFWGEIIVVTQELGDILGNKVVKDSILNNSDTIILLDQTKFKDHYDEIASLLSINENERKKIFTINQFDNSEGRGRFKEVYIRRGATGEVYGVEVSLHQYLTYTTEKPEKAAVETYIDFYGNYQIGLDFFVEDFKSSGYGLHQFFSLINSLDAPYREKKNQLA
ncbi:conjugal transfer protein TraG [Rhodonellum psychrophilum GCM71 = DSM 17998]|uniref:Conjugal transfer protein TraG n=2 Tax=Rhodonellum TaxID=336827 RepID=U5BR32_9BACT|nr:MULTISPECIES: TraG family conjugative transposon ATPase [Rhodonellum]ERM83050.1 conjugal transfer protein TraG [Rhodonellum psychrophilum GCM71 = DSM 17998]SDZ47359.1 Bacteroides conjugation system ATPase, TraG family [Rhodonellum ikkaensis]